jgi:transglutaminase-like putative cysteine protease
MRIRAGYEIVYHCPQKTPMILKVHVHYSRARDIVVPDHLNTDPLAPVTAHRDVYGNWCSRIVAPIGRIRLSGNVVIDDTGEPDVVAAGAQQHKVRDLPEETLSFLLGSRYCETDLLSEAAWRLFLGHAPGMERRPGDCDDVHKHIVFGYGDARSTRTAFESFQECKGVRRDFAHLAIASLCANIDETLPAAMITEQGGKENHRERGQECSPSRSQFAGLRSPGQAATALV